MNGDSTPTVIPHVEIHTDGACEPNPGPGGYGAVLIHPKKRAKVSGGFRKTTNNRMEIFAAIAGLEMLKQRCKVTRAIRRRSDAINSRWQPCASPIFRRTTVTKTNPKPTASAPRNRFPFRRWSGNIVRNETK